MALLLAGPLLLRTVTGDRSAGESTAVRVLGARDVVQAGAQTVAPTLAPRVGVAVDAVHALSMLALAVVVPRHRRAAACSALVAAGFAAVGWRSLDRHRH